MNWLTKYAAQGEWLRRRAENVLALLLFLMFAAFMLQIVFRYVLNWPIGWTNEISVALWIWIVLFGAAFVVRESEEIRFDLFWAGAGDRARRIMVLIMAVALISTFARLAAGRYRLCDVHEGREDRLSQDPLRLALFDLCRLRRRHDRPLSLARHPGNPRQGSRGL